ncbi:hypothetical protein chiPu_0001081 [Chiloscyllium punctatum]|uniref:Uncharacterized protein n=1 Tax=Chiloscyllium punctatum TaxID=137246 RepID=A0A401RX21_CHIPU|nr:hypothetical protein [Chiloscyllium punctatum]
MKNIMLCVCTVTLPEYRDEDCMLIGDDDGFLNRIIVGSDDLNFQKSMESDALRSQALDPRLLRRPILRRKLHNGWVLRVKYFAHLNCFACCSPDSVHSLVLDDIRKLGDCQVWDVQTLAVLQVFTTGERKGDRHINIMIFDAKNKRLITGSNIVELVPLMSAVQDSMLVPLSHEKSINVLVYSKMNAKLASICSKSVLKVWEVQTGQKLYQIEHPHGHGIEVTAGAVDQRGMHLITGAADGSIITWELYTGEKVKLIPPTTENTEDDHRISQLYFLNYGNPQIMLAFGWKNKIKLLQVSRICHNIYLASLYVMKI